MVEITETRLLYECISILDRPLRRYYHIFFYRRFIEKDQHPECFGFDTSGGRIKPIINLFRYRTQLLQLSRDTWYRWSDYDRSGGGSRSGAEERKLANYMEVFYNCIAVFGANFNLVIVYFIVVYARNALFRGHGLCFTSINNE